MKKTITLLACAIAGLSFGQVINPSFEQWENVTVKDSVKNWTTSTAQFQNVGAMNVNNASIITDAQDGNQAVHLETMFVGGDTLGGYLVNSINAGGDLVGFPYTEQIDELTGWYKCNILPNDTALAVVMLRKNGSNIGGGIHKFAGSTSTWSSFSLPLLGGNLQAPDTVIVGFISSNDDVPANIQEGSWLEIDNISFKFGGNAVATPIPNHSFEDTVQVNIPQPSDWFSFDAVMYNKVNALSTTKSTDATEGNYAVRLEVLPEFVSQSIPTVVTNGYFDMIDVDFAGGDVFTAIANQFSFQYKYAPSGADTAAAKVVIWNANSTILDTNLVLLSSATWSNYTLPLNYSNTPDSVRIIFYAGANAGSVLELDEVSFSGGDVGLNENVFTFLQTFPNPANDYFIVNDVAGEPISQLAVYNIAGQLIYSKANVTLPLNINTSQWEEGIYLLKIDSQNQSITRKVIVQH